MPGQEVLRDLVRCLKEDERLKGRDWQSLTYWSSGVGVALRRYKYYEEHLRINSSSLVDFHIYLPGISDSLCVFNNVVSKLPELEKSLRTKWPNIRISYENLRKTYKRKNLKSRWPWRISSYPLVIRICCEMCILMCPRH